MTSDFDWINTPLWDDDDPEFVTEAQLKRPAMHARKVARRQMLDGLAKQSLSELVPELPDMDTELYILSNGSGSTYRASQDTPYHFELGHFLTHIVDLLGDGCTAYVSTWTMARAHAENMLKLYDAGQITSLSVLTGKYFVTREAAVANTLMLGLEQRGQRFRAFKNHSKIIAVRNADGTRFCNVLSSANLSSQPRVENLTINTAPDVYQWLRDEFFEVMLNAKSD